MSTLILVRHGQSLWNAQNRFTGWEDIDLSPKGEQEARKAGQLLRKHSLHFDCAWTSVLKRAIRTLWILLEETNHCFIPVSKTWRLNERHYGELQGLNKKETALKYGESQVLKWRRGYDTSPPFLSQPSLQKSHPAFKEISQIPRGESLKDTLHRVLPVWEKEISPALSQNKNILITAHGNSLRSLIKHIQKIPDDEIFSLEIPTAQPLKMTWNDFKNKPEDFNFVSNMEQDG